MKLEDLGWDAGWAAAMSTVPSTVDVPGLTPARVAVEHRGAYQVTAGAGLEWAELRGRDLYLLLPGGAGRSKLTADLSRRGARSGTMRNWRTVTTLATMAAEADS